MKNTYRWLAGLIGLHLLLGLVYDWATPIFEASDEGAHYAVVRWLAQGHGLPVQNPQAPSTLWAQEGSQPPLYYLLSAGLTAWINTPDYDQLYVQNPFTQFAPGTPQNANLYRHPWSGPALAGTVLAVKVARWWSLFLSCLTVGLTFWLARRVLPGAERVAFLAAALVAFNPMTLFINASVNNDNLLMFLSTAAVLVTVVDMQASGGWSLRRSALLGLLVGLAALTKVSGLVLWPVAALGVAWGAWKARDWKRFAFSGLVIAVVAVGVSGWWFWRNLNLYGDWLGLKTMVAIAGPRPASITLLDLVRQEGAGFYLSYWGVFGAFTILPPAWVQLFYGALTVLSVAGGGLALLRVRAWPRVELWLLALFSAFTLVGVVNWTLQTLASQGRLLFGAIAPLSIFMALGLAALGSVVGIRRSVRLPAWATGAAVGLLALVALIVPVAYIAPHYVPTRVLAESDLPKDMHEAHITVESKIELVGYASDALPRRPGERQRVTLYWRALQPMTEDYVLALHLLGRGVEEVAKLDTWPGGGLAPTSQWPAGGLLADTYWLPISSTATAPSQLKLDLAFWSGEADNKLPMAAADGARLDKSLGLVVGRLAPAQAPAFKPALAEGTRFEYGISLLGLDTGKAGRLTLYWKTDQVVPGNYTVFLHVLDAAGTQVTQADGPPLNGDWPTSAWVPGMAFADGRQVAEPAKLAPGRYTVSLGLYEPELGARVAAFRADGTEWPDDMVVLKDAWEVKMKLSSNWRSLNPRVYALGALVALAAVGLGALLGYAGLLITVGVLGALAAALWALTSLEVGLWGVVAIITLLPFGALPLKVVVTPTFLDLAMLAVVTVYAFQWMTGRRRQIALTPAHGPVALFLALAVFSFVAGMSNGPLTSNLVRHFVELLFNIGFVFVLVDFLSSREKLDQLVLVIIGCGTLAAVVGIVFYFMPDTLSERLLSSLRVFNYPSGGVLRYIEDNPDNAQRAIGTSVDPNVLGGLLALVGALLAPQLVARRPVLRWRWPSWGAFGVVVACLLLTYSRTALAALGVALAGIALARYRRLLWLILLVVLVIGLLPVAQTYEMHFLQGLQGQDLATQMRFGEYKDALILIGRHPLGVGFAGTPEIDVYLGVSNAYLVIVEEMGLVGLAGFLLIIAAVLGWSFVNRRAVYADERLTPVWLGAHAGLAAALTVGMADHYFFNIDFQPSGAIFWIFVALCLAATRLAAQKPREGA